jgi:hypothetical protein
MDRTYKVGDKVWYATFGSREIQVPCPVCYGNKTVTVILGNGDEVAVECDYCQKGFSGARGFVTEYEHSPAAEYLTIQGCRIEQDMDGDKVQYTSNHYSLYPEKMFDTEEEALEHAVKMAEEDAQRKSEKPKYKNEKSYAWNAGYHMKQAQSKRKEADYHEVKAKICKTKSKQEK